MGRYKSTWSTGIKTTHAFYLLVSGVMALVVLLTSPRLRAEIQEGPVSPVRPPLVRVMGEPLETSLPVIGKQYQVRLTAAPPMKGQRVTVYAKEAPLELLARGLTELLSSSAEERVSWSRGEQGEWTLDETVARRRLADRLREQSLTSYRTLLENEATWAGQQGNPAIDAARAALPRPFLHQRVTHALLLDSLGKDGRDRLFAGAPCTLTVGDLAPVLRDLVRERLTLQHRLAAPAEELDRYRLVYVIGREPERPRSFCLFVSVILPGKGVGIRYGELGMSDPWALPAVYGLFELLPPPPGDRSRRVSLVLTPERGADPKSTVLRNLNQVLEVLARECGLNVIADGYLRPPREYPVNFAVQEVPLHTLLRQLLSPYGCRWRFLDAEERTLLIRAEDWWAEDLMDVSEAVVADFGSKLGPGKMPALSDLLRLAELPRAQVHKLIETGICPAADGIILQGWNDGASPVTPWLRFYKRLQPALQARARSPEGLPLKDVPPELVEKWLTVPLVAGIGAITPAEQADLAFSILPNGGGGYEVAVRRGEQTCLSRHIPRFAYFSKRIHDSAKQVLP